MQDLEREFEMDEAIQKYLDLQQDRRAGAR
jgi:hypothetical protein